MQNRKRILEWTYWNGGTTQKQNAHLDEIALLEDCLILRDERREVTGAIVDRDASGEGNTLIHLDLVVNLGGLILDLLVGSLAELDNRFLRDNMCQDLVHNN